MMPTLFFWLHPLFKRISRMTDRGLVVGALAAVAVALQAAWPLAASAQAQAPGWRATCPGAAKWLDEKSDHLVAAMKARDAQRQLSKPALLAELQRRVDEDQEARREWTPGKPNADADALVRRVDADNLRWLKRQLVRYGLPTADEVGEYGLHLTWLLVHHADDSPDVQRIALGMFKQRLDAGEFDAADFARLSDRVAVKQGHPQPYGTQYQWVKGGLEAQNIPNLEEVVKNREALGLMSLADYGCMMHALRGIPRQPVPSDVTPPPDIR